MSMILSRLRSLSAAAMVFLLLLLALFAGLMPGISPFGYAAGGVLDTGQVGAERWWMGAVLALAAYAGLSWPMARMQRLWWLAVLLAGLVLGIMTFGYVASTGQGRAEGRSGAAMALEPLHVGVSTALPLFWPEGASVSGLLRDDAPSHMPFVQASRHHLMPLDHLDALSLAKTEALLLAQPRLLQAEELVALDDWVRSGGRAVIFADPLLIWPGDLPMGDPRRPPVTSLLDPLLKHWGLSLAPVAEGAEGVSRHMLDSGHVLLLAGASRFSAGQRDEPQDRCRLVESGLIAQCKIGKGQVRLVADADVLDDRLWLADRQRPEHSTAHASDIIMLMDAWLTDPEGRTILPPPRRVVDDGALVSAMRLAMLVLLSWVALGWFGQRRFFDGSGRLVHEADKNK